MVNKPGVERLNYVCAWCDKFSDLFFGKVHAISTTGSRYMRVGTAYEEQKRRGRTSDARDC